MTEQPETARQAPAPPPSTEPSDGATAPTGPSDGATALTGAAEGAGTGARSTAGAGRGALRRVRRDVAQSPFIVIWEVTRACPLACLHCRAEAVPDRDPRELTTDEAGELMRQVADFGRPAPLFVITGGDPFERPDLFELVRRGRRLGLSPAVSPSATPALTPDNLARLREAGAGAISLSLDGATPAVHDEFRGYDGVFSRTMTAWRAAREAGLKVQINTTVTRRNLARLPDIARLVRDRGALLWSVFFLVPTGRGRALSALGPEEAEDVLHFLYDLGTTIPVKTTEAHHFRRVSVQRLILAERGADHTESLGPLYRDLRRRARRAGLIRESRVRRPPVDVNAGRGFVFVSHTGTVHPSGFLPLGAGNVRDRPLTEIYRSAPLFAELRDPDRLRGRCGACEFRAICGGSRSRAYATTGDVLAEEPWCGYRPGTFPYQDDLARHIRTP